MSYQSVQAMVFFYSKWRIAKQSTIDRITDKRDKYNANGTAIKSGSHSKFRLTFIG